MAKRIKTPKATKIADDIFKGENSTDVFGGSVDKAELESKGIQGWDKAQELGASSETHLEDDQGEGDPMILRQFIFGINPIAFAEAKPAKQDLFNHHLKGIELSLWKDGLQLWDGVEPRIHIDSKKMQYTIYVTAIPSRGNMFSALHAPKKLTEILHGRPTN